MHRNKGAQFDWRALGIATILVGWLVGTPVLAYAQAGANAVMPSSGSPLSSVAFVDALGYSASGTDICSAIRNILGTYKSSGSNGLVIDARGFSGAGLTCSSSDPINPWNTGADVPYNNTVLLPVGTIQIYTPWILPENTRIVGEGRNLTTIQAQSASAFTGAAVVYMGGNGTLSDGSGQYCGYTPPSGTSNGNWYCLKIVIEHLQLNGGTNSNISGIVNQYSQESSYVDDVVLTNITGTGLFLGGGSAAATSCPSGSGSGYCEWGSGNSGPYTNITYSGSGTCVRIIAGLDNAYNSSPGNPVPPQTRGIHGLTCNMTMPGAACSSGSSQAAICLDAPNNTIEDVSITGASSSQDGILIGDSSAAHANVVFNISGSGLGNLIHIASNTTLSGAPPSLCQPGNITNPPNACDVTILGATSSSSTSTIQDDLAGTKVTDPTVGMYILGEMAPGVAGYSRFTTSPNWPSWSFGTNTIPSNTTCTRVGSLYSLTTGSGVAGSNGTPGSTLWGCQGPQSAPAKWVPIPVE
jgi:hypothetical protein